MDELDERTMDPNALIKKHRGIVIKVVGPFLRRIPTCVDKNDLIQVGLMALVSCGATFDPAKGSFSTHAYPRVRGEIYDELRRSDPLSRGQRSFHRERSRTIEELTSVLCRNPHPSEVATALGMELEIYLRKSNQTSAETALSTSGMFTDVEGQLRDFFERANYLEDQVDPLEQLQVNRRLRELERLWGIMSERERVIMTGIFIDGTPYAKIAASLNLTVSRVCQLSKALMERWIWSIDRI